MVRHSLRAASLALTLAACGGDVQVDLRIIDACNQELLEDLAVLDLAVEGRELASPMSSLFPVDKGVATLPDIPPTHDALITVSGYSDFDVQGSDPVAFGATGYLDLSEEAPVQEITAVLTLGATGRFAGATTDDNGETQCTEVRLEMPRYGHTATPLRDGRVLLVGGIDLEGNQQTITARCEIYDPVSGTFTAVDPLPTGGRAFHTATALDNGTVLIVGGFGVINGQKTALVSGVVFDPTLQEGFGGWTGDDRIVLTSPRVHHTATRLSDGRVLVIGGLNREESCDQDSCFEDTYEYFEQTDSDNDGVIDDFEFTPGAEPLEHARANHTATLLDDDEVLITGGRDADAVLGSMELIVSNRVFEIDDTLDEPRSHHAAARSGSRVYISGGFSALEPSELRTSPPLNSIEVFFRSSGDNGEIGCDGSLDPMQQERAGHSMIVLANGDILIAGGVGSDTRPLDDAELINVPSEASGCGIVQSAGDHLVIQRAYFATAVLPGGNILITGGLTRNEGGNLQSTPRADIYVPERR